MLYRLLLAAVLIAMAVMNSGCSTLADARAARGTGEARIFNAPADTVWRTLPGIIKEVGLDFVGDNRQDGYLLAQRGISLFSYGEHVAIFVEPVAKSDKTRVEVVSKKAMATNLIVPNWEIEILDKLGAKIGAGTAAMGTTLVAQSSGSPTASATQANVPPANAPQNGSSQQPVADAGPSRPRLDDVHAVPFIREAGKDGYEKFLALKRRPRVFVISDKGGWVYKTGPNAAKEALAFCEARYANCYLYAVDNEVVWSPPASSEGR